MDNSFQEAVETAFGQGKIPVKLKNMLLDVTIKPVAQSCAEKMVTTSGLKGSKLSVFLDWLFADPTRVLDLLMKILGIFASKETTNV